MDVLPLRSDRLLRTVADAPLANGDLLLFRGTGLISRLISIAGRSPYTHAAKLWLFPPHPSRLSSLAPQPLVLEVREWYGGRIVTLESQVEQCPGRIDVFGVNPKFLADYDALGALHVMRRFAGASYGYGAVLKTAMLHMIGVRVARSADVDDLANGSGPPYCSHAVAIADRTGGNCDAVPMLADKETEPGDLARGPLYGGQYKCTLVPAY